MAKHDVAGDSGPLSSSEPGKQPGPASRSGLHYVDDSRPGIRRRRLRQRFAYFTPKGERIRDEEEIRRINKLAVPPAYTDVWICPDPQGHLQATGRDARGRKQYRYHPHWREIRDQQKYGRLLKFGEALPRIRARVAHDLALPGMPREKILATLVHLLDVTLIRIGNEEYARSNRSFGLTTLRNRHVEVRGGKVCFRFRGKSGVEHDVALADARIARIIRRCLEIPGQELFQYLDEKGKRHGLDSSDVNAYLREISGADFTAKDYRTWAGSAFALARLREIAFETQREAKSNVVATLREVAGMLGNTPAVCRKAYVHPLVIEAYTQGRLGPHTGSQVRKLKGEEGCLLAFLRAAKADAKKPAKELTALLAESVKDVREGRSKRPSARHVAQRPGARHLAQAARERHARQGVLRRAVRGGKGAGTRH